MPKLAKKIITLTILIIVHGAALAQNNFSVIKGKFEQGSLLFCQTDVGAQVSIDGRPVRVSNAGQFVFGLDRDAAPSVQISIALPQQQAQIEMLPVAGRSYSIQRLHFPQHGGEASPELEARMAMESEENRSARARDTDAPYLFERFSWPALGKITGVFGSQRIINGETRQPHYGVDVAGPVGTPVYAPADGVVSLAAPSMLLSGGTLYLDHGFGVSSAFLHLSHIDVNEGEHVRKGQQIARMGKTGRVTGPHLDWRVNWFESRVDPVGLAGPMPSVAR